MSAECGCWTHQQEETLWSAVEALGQFAKGVSPSAFSGSRLCVIRKTRAPTTSKTRIAENAIWLIDTLVRPPKTRRTSERPSAPIESRACRVSWPLTHVSDL